MRAQLSRFDDLVAGVACVFPTPERVVAAWTAAEVRPALTEVDEATRAGAWASGFVAYEAATGLDASLHAHDPRDGVPLVWFAVSGPPAAAAPITGSAERRPYTLSGWRFDRPTSQHRTGITRVMDAIAAGDTFEVNLTTRLTAAFSGDALGLYRDLCARQRSAYAAFVDTGPFAVASVSPELFFSWSGSLLTTRPMKGTAARGASTGDDDSARRGLLTSDKERAENLIVVDLMRNDLGRVAATGSVRATTIGRAERYDTVWQLTSEIRATVDAETPLADVFTALFPSGSVTGAPKPRTTEIIRDLEDAPRGVYCGAIGWVAPPQASTRARFSVAIRTVELDARAGTAAYGVGGAITWGSDPDRELAELKAKAQVLTRADSIGDHALVETMAYVPGVGIRNREAHLARLAASAAWFGIPHGDAASRALDEVTAEQPTRVRLTLDAAGTVRVELAAVPSAPVGQVSLAVDDEPVARGDPWLVHKTTRRSVYETRAARHHADDVVLVNEDGLVTETTIANIAVLVDGRWSTPPVSDGLLPGVERGRLVAAGVLTERSITRAELLAAPEIALVSSLRGWRAGCVQQPPERSRDGR